MDDQDNQDNQGKSIHEQKTLVKNVESENLNDQSPQVESNDEATVVAPPKTPQSDDKTVPLVRSRMGDATPAVTNPAVTTPADLTPHTGPRIDAHLQAGTEVGIGTILRERFVLKKELGSGGMGAVFRALDLRKQEAGDNKPFIAIKLLKGAFKHHDKAFVTLQREAKKTQELAHPNIVTVYDFDRVGDVVYLTMEELQGKPLNDVINGPDKLSLDYKSKIRIITEIARGLVYAHSKGIIHSDLKPANIFITDKGVAKILDFGIARAANEDLYQDNFDAGELGALTYPYASLEMIRSEDPHPADDIYALGIIACELLGKKHPYNRKDALFALEHKMQATVPGFRNPLMRQWINKSLALERAERTQSATAFIKKLRFANSGPRRIAGIAAIVLLAFLGNYIYIQNIELEVVPFESLSKEAQQEFMLYINKGEDAIGFGDLDGAVYFIDQAFAIHETHKPLEVIKDKVRLLLQENIDMAPDEATQELFVKQLEELEKHPAFSPGASSED